VYTWLTRNKVHKIELSPSDYTHQYCVSLRIGSKGMSINCEGTQKERYGAFGIKLTEESS
jgi:hypothetical protein